MDITDLSGKHIGQLGSVRLDISGLRSGDVGLWSIAQALVARELLGLVSLNLSSAGLPCGGIPDTTMASVVIALMEMKMGIALPTPVDQTTSESSTGNSNNNSNNNSVDSSADSFPRSSSRGKMRRSSVSDQTTYLTTTTTTTTTTIGHGSQSNDDISSLLSSSMGVDAEGIKTILASLSWCRRRCDVLACGLGWQALFSSLSLSPHLTLTSLRSLDLSRCGLGIQSPSDSLSLLTQANTATTLSSPSSPSPSSSVTNDLASLPIDLPSVVSTPTDDSTLKWLFKFIATSKTLEELNLSDNALGSHVSALVVDPAKDSASTSSSPSLSSSPLSPSLLSITTTTTLVVVKPCPSLEALCAAVIASPSLRILDLSRNGIDDAGAHAIATMLAPNANLVTGTSPCVAVLDAAWSAGDGTSTKACSLERLVLDDNSIGSSGGVALGQALQWNTSLLSLSLSTSSPYLALHSSASIHASSSCASLAFAHGLTHEQFAHTYPSRLLMATRGLKPPQPFPSGGIVAIATALAHHNDTLIDLDLSGSHCLDEGAHAIASILNRKPLVSPQPIIPPTRGQTLGASLEATSLAEAATKAPRITRALRGSAILASSQARVASALANQGAAGRRGSEGRPDNTDESGSAPPLSPCHLQHLSLRCANIGVSGLREIAQAIKHCPSSTLESLDLSGNGVIFSSTSSSTSSYDSLDNATGDFIRATIHCPHLSTLTLLGLPLGPNALSSLSALVKSGSSHTSLRVGPAASRPVLLHAFHASQHLLPTNVLPPPPSQTHSSLQQFELVCVLIHPEATHRASLAVQSLLDAGAEIVSAKRLRLSPTQAQAYLRIPLASPSSPSSSTTTTSSSPSPSSSSLPSVPETSSSSSSPSSSLTSPAFSSSERHDLITHYRSLRSLVERPSIALLCQGIHACRTVSDLLGPEDPVVARTTSPDSLRALLGKNSECLGISASKDMSTALVDAQILFGPQHIQSLLGDDPSTYKSITVAYGDALRNALRSRPVATDFFTDEPNNASKDQYTEEDHGGSGVEGLNNGDTNNTLSSRPTTSEGRMTDPSEISTSIKPRGTASQVIDPRLESEWLAIQSFVEPRPLPSFHTLQLHGLRPAALTALLTGLILPRDEEDEEHLPSSGQPQHPHPLPRPLFVLPSLKRLSLGGGSIWDSQSWGYLCRAVAAASLTEISITHAILPSAYGVSRKALPQSIAFMTPFTTMNSMYSSSSFPSPSHTADEDKAAREWLSTKGFTFTPLPDVDVEQWEEAIPLPVLPRDERNATISSCLHSLLSAIRASGSTAVSLDLSYTYLGDGGAWALGRYFKDVAVEREAHNEYVHQSVNEAVKAMTSNGQPHLHDLAKVQQLAREEALELNPPPSDPLVSLSLRGCSLIELDDDDDDDMVSHPSRGHESRTMKQDISNAPGLLSFLQGLARRGPAINHLNLADNHLNSPVLVRLAEVMASNRSLTSLDLSLNSLPASPAVIAAVGQLVGRARGLKVLYLPDLQVIPSDVLNPSPSSSSSSSSSLSYPRTSTSSPSSSRLNMSREAEVLRDVTMHTITEGLRTNSSLQCLDIGGMLLHGLSPSQKQLLTSAISQPLKRGNARSSLQRVTAGGCALGDAPQSLSITSNHDRNSDVHENTFAATLAANRVELPFPH